MPQANLKVVGVMCGSHLHRTGTETDFAVFVAHNRDLPVHNRQDASLADKMLKLLVSRVHSHARVSHHSLRSGGGDDNVTAAVGKRIAHIPKVAGLISVLHLSIRQGRQAVWTPVDDSLPTVNQTFIIKDLQKLP